MLKEIPKVEHKGNQYTPKMETSVKVEESKNSLRENFEIRKESNFLKPKTEAESAENSL